ncbi:MAG TPA: iron ABC transporter permease [Pyrinomonadaceae bacterium]|nr:iron ABC transporter permease [Pyrinomonadaceae bacterium]
MLKRQETAMDKRRINIFRADVASFFTVRSLIVGGAVMLFVLLCVLPIFYMLALSFVNAQGDFSFENYRHLLLIDERQRQLLLNSTMLGGGAAVMSTLVGVPLGILFARAELPMKNLLRIALIVPLVVPPYILALSWILLFGRVYPDFAYSLTGAILILGTSFYPLQMLATEAAIRSVDERMEEAALLVAPPWRVLFRITLPLIAPIVSAVFLIIFVLSIAEFGVPGLLRVRVFTTEVFTAFAALYDFGAATALALPLIIITFLVALIAKRIIGEKSLVSRKSSSGAIRLSSSIWRFAAIGFFATVFLTAVCLPFGVLISEAVHVKNISLILSESGNAIFNSLALSAISATLVVIPAAILGYARTRAKTRWSWLADVAFIVIFAVPSTVVGIGIIGLWNRGFLSALYTSQAIIIIAYLARFTSVAALILGASVRQIPVSLEEAASVSGASWQRLFFKIVLPNMKAGIAATWLTIFVFAFGELGTTLLVAPPGESTLPVRIYTIIANTSLGEVAALALLQISVVLIPLIVFVFFVNGAGKIKKEDA